MDKIEKYLSKFANKEKSEIKNVLSILSSRPNKKLDIKKLKGRSDIFRVRKGKFRIIYRVDKNNEIFILTIERRSDTTYNKF